MLRGVKGLDIHHCTTEGNDRRGGPAWLARPAAGDTPLTHQMVVVMIWQAQMSTFLRRWTLRLVWSVALVFATIVIGGALDARRRLPDLQPWHRIVPRDARAADLTPSFTFAGYLALEEAAFRTVREQIEQRLDPAWRLPSNRYNPDGLAHPGRLGTDWNRTQTLSPAAEPIGGALLVHGLTDAPYSMRTIGEDLRGRGYEVIALRIPGHGTVPAALTDVTWEDWAAAVRLGVRHLRATVGNDRPVVLEGEYQWRDLVQHQRVALQIMFFQSHGARP
jgi:hypothetical protein